MSTVNTSPNNGSPQEETDRSSSLGLWFWIITAAVLTAFVFLTLQRNEVWRSARTLWEDVVRKSPGKPGGHINIAQEHYRDGNVQAAIQEYQLAAQLANDRYRATGNLRERELLALAQANTGTILLKSKVPEERETGIKALRATLTLMPNFAPAALPLAKYESDRKNYFEAIRLITDSINAGIGSGFPQVGTMYYVRAEAYCDIGALPQANQDFQTAAKTDADIPLTLCQKGE